MRKRYVCLALIVLICLAAAVLLLTRETGRKVYAWQGDVAFFEQDDRIGLMNRRGEVLLEPMLTQAGLFDGNALATVAFPGGCGLLNWQGDFVHHAPGYDFVQFFSEEYQTYQVCGIGAKGCYYLNATGEITAEPAWNTESIPMEQLPENTRRLKNGSLLVQEGDGFCIRQEDGTLVKELTGYVRIEESRVWNEETAWLMADMVDGSWRILTLDGKVQAKPEKPCVRQSAVVGGMVRVSMQEGLGFMDLSGRIHSDTAWTRVNDFMGGLGTADIGDQTLVFIAPDGRERFRLTGLWRAYLSWATQVDGAWYYRVMCTDPQDGSILGTWVNERGELLCPPA